MQLAPNDQKRGIRTHIMLVVAMALVIAIVTGLCLLLIRHRLHAQVQDDLSQDLKHSVITFQNLQAERVAALDRENSLLAELPTLKALMTSGDDLTIQDGATEFWQLSGNDLFALADSNGRLVAVYAKSPNPDAALVAGLKTLIASPDKHYLIDGRGLYVCSLRPLYFGSDRDGTTLGYVISGISIERTVREISQPTGAEATFLSGGKVVASTLNLAGQSSLEAQRPTTPTSVSVPSMVRFGATRYLASSEDLSAAATSPLQFVVLKSFEPAELSINRINRMVLSAGLIALLSGTLLMVALSRLVTRPLEELSKSVIAFGIGDSTYRIPRYGTQEVRQLSKAFAGMRSEIHQANHALIESERLATIGRMASSVSHDLRHYLAAIYANSEFLATHRLSDKERAEIFSEIRAAVHGTTDMIESLLIFSNTGNCMRRAPELMASILDGAIALVRAHPDADGVDITSVCADPTGTCVVVDAKQIERSICNLLLNACQAAREQNPAPRVHINLERHDKQVILSFRDNGHGVSENIRDSLFAPFVSEGKQKGTGLGLTLAHCIALEHGGEVTLLSSCPGETVFQMRVACDLQPSPASAALDAKRQTNVLEHQEYPT